jgi:hypothetical protein
MLYYYLNLPKGKNLDFAENMRKSMGKLYAAKDFFEPYETYLNNAIKALNNKAQIKARWKECTTENFAELKVLGNLYEIRKQTQIQVKGNDVGCYRFTSSIDDPDFSEKLRFKVGDKTGKVDVPQKDFNEGFIRLPTEVETFDKIIWGFNTDIDIEPAWMPFQREEILRDTQNRDYKIVSVDSNVLAIEGYIADGIKLFYNNKEIAYEKLSDNNADITAGSVISDENTKKIIYSGQPVTNAVNVNYKAAEYLDFNNISYSDGTKVEFEHDNALIIKLKSRDDYGKIVISKGIKLNISEIQKNGRDVFWVQLYEDEADDARDDIHGLSPLRYFFDDDVTVVDADNRRNKYKVEKGGKEEENRLVLMRLNPETKKNEYCFPQSAMISVEVNTYNLEKQLEAITTLKNMPVCEQAKLIQLFENRLQTNWERLSPQSVNEWYVLTDSERSGAEQQQNFVNKALGTPDFAIMEGPPGSGKTTTILELICQLSKQGKRVLLCGSTHVAIDNILEGLCERNLLGEFSIFPVRIGDENRINSDIVKQLLLKNLTGGNKDIENLVLDSATLVCGTTLGILQHPQFKDRKPLLNKQTNKKQWIAPIVPEFDYLIIDESSKTTFQEFLVPALYAKKWILIGDVMQLSPFTDQEDIVTNVTGLAVDGKILDINLQNAIFYLQKLINCTEKKNNECKNNRFILPVSETVLQCIFDELSGGRVDTFYIDLFGFITNLPLPGDDQRFMIRTGDAVTRLELSAANIIFVDKLLFNSGLWEKFPESHAILEFDQDWEETGHAYKHNAFQQQERNRFNYWDRGKTFKDSFEIVREVHNFLRDRNWAEEIAWRINTIHQLRLSEDNRKRTKYTDEFVELMPKSKSINGDAVKTGIDNIANLAYPSILESLSPRKQLDRNVVDEKESTISAGFTEEDLQLRKITLEYQHRMHPDISRFPREQFYKNENALRDLETPIHIRDRRNWNYNCYPSRNVWVNVNGRKVKNFNPDEANTLIVHLNKFLDFAKQNDHPERKQWKVACLTFYRGQETCIRKELQKIPGNNERKISRFFYKIDNGQNIEIRLHTVDKFQGDEADIVFLSMREVNRDGFLNNPNRLNVAITRARFQLVIFGKYDYFLNKSQSDELKALTKSMTRVEGS